MRGKTKDWEGKEIEVEVLSTPDLIGMVKCRLNSGCLVARHMSRLEMLPEPAEPLLTIKEPGSA